MRDKNGIKKNGYRINELGVYIYGQRAVVTDGGAEILDYTKERVVFRTPKKRVNLVISGKELTVRAAGNSVCEICGLIQSVKYEEVKPDV